MKVHGVIVHNACMDSVKEEIAATAARMVVEEGLEYGAAKRRATRQLRLSVRAALPDNEVLERAVADYIATFCAAEQARELQALRTLALGWMERLERFRPHIGGAVWRGTATRWSDIYLQLFCDEPKLAEIALIDWGIHYAVGQVAGFNVDALSIHAACPALATHVGVHLLVHDFDDVRGAMKPDAQGRKLRGDTEALRNLLDDAHL